MKQGLSLQELAAELERQKEAKKDYVAPTTQLQAKVSDGAVKIDINGHGEFGINSVAHGQVSERLGIPKKYYDRMIEEAPELLVSNVNHWLHQNPDRRMVRTMDGKVRAFLSERYRRLDNFDVAQAALPQLVELGAQVESSNITDSRIYIKAIVPSLSKTIQPSGHNMQVGALAADGVTRVGDVVQAGIVISNSEVGQGSLKVEPLIWTLACTNAMIVADHSMKKYHVGRAAGGEMDSAQELFSDETLKADDKAFFMKVRDVVKASFKEDVFGAVVVRLQESTEAKIDGKVSKVVEVVQKQFELTENEGEGVLQHLIQGGDLSQYGMVNAITRASQDVEDYERATDLERLGGKVLELGREDWTAIASQS